MTKISQAMIQAAGLGTRLRPLTLKKPKPLLAVNDYTLIDLAIDTLAENGVTDIAVNTHYLADQLQTHLSRRVKPHIHISHEKELLDTGGGIKKATSLLDPDKPLFCLSSDWYWEDKLYSPYFAEMSLMWNADKMDILQLLIPKTAMSLTTSSGDYDVDEKGQAVRSRERTGEYMWTSVRIFHPRIFKDTPSGPFSFLECLDKAEQEGRLFACCMSENLSAPWHHISTMDDYEAVTKHLSGHATKENGERKKLNGTIHG